MADQNVDLETLLREELAIEPSVEFLPRVRERIAAEPTPRRATWFWIASPVAAAATLALALWLPANDGVVPPASPAPPVALSASPRSLEPGPPTTAAARRPVPRRAPRADDSAEVIVDARQREALLAFIRLANQGQLTDAAFKGTSVPPAVIKEQIVTIEVDEVAVSPMAGGGVLLPGQDK